MRQIVPSRSLTAPLPVAASPDLTGARSQPPDPPQPRLVRLPQGQPRHGAEGRLAAGGAGRVASVVVEWGTDPTPQPPSAMSNPIQRSTMKRHRCGGNECDGLERLSCLGAAGLRWAG